MGYSISKGFSGGGVGSQIANNFAGGPGNIAANAATLGTYGAAKTLWQQGGVGKQAAKAAGMDHSKQDDLSNEGDKVATEQYQATQPVLGQMTQNEQDYSSALGKSTKEYMNYLSGLQKDAESQAKDARTTYSNDIMPKLKGAMEDAQREASGAMTLQQAGDPNNSVQQAVRDLYERQAVAEGNRGKADFGVLSALGAQAMGQQFSGMPGFTGSQFQLAQAGSQQQAGQAYGNTQRRMQALRDQGLNQGFAQSAAQYDRGQQAKDRYNQNIQNYQGGLGNYMNMSQQMRNVGQGYESAYQGARMGEAQSNLGMQQGQAQRQLGSIGDLYGGKQQSIANQINMSNAQNAQQAGIMGGVLTAGMTGLGALAGGAQGAQAGATAGSGIAAGMRPQQAQYQAYQPQANYGTYGR